MNFKEFEEKMKKWIDSKTIMNLYVPRNDCLQSALGTANFVKNPALNKCCHDIGKLYNITLCPHCKTIIISNYWGNKCFRFTCAETTQRTLCIRKYKYSIDQKNISLDAQLTVDIEKTPKKVISFRDQFGDIVRDGLEFSDFSREQMNELGFPYTFEDFLQDMECCEIWTRTGLKEYMQKQLQRWDDSYLTSKYFEAFTDYLKYYLKKKSNRKIELISKIGFESLVRWYIWTNTDFPDISGVKNILPFSKPVVQFVINEFNNDYQKQGFVKEGLALLQQMNAKKPLEKVDIEHIFSISHLKWDAILWLIQNGYTYQNIREYCQRADDYQAILADECIVLLRDYVRMAKDMNVPYDKYPQSLKKYHDIISREYGIYLSTEEQAIFKKRAEENKHLEYQSDKFLLRIPEKIEDLVREGKMLHHCVASYTRSIITHKCVILFLRKAEAPDEPYFTIEYNNGLIKQIRGFSNCNLNDPEAKTFIEMWRKKVARQNNLISAAA